MYQLQGMCTLLIHNTQVLYWYCTQAEKGTNIKDVQDFMVTVPTLEYHNRNWTWGDMLMEVKKVYKQHIIQKVSARSKYVHRVTWIYLHVQGIKTVFGMREEDEAAKPSPLSMYVLYQCAKLKSLLHVSFTVVV